MADSSTEGSQDIQGDLENPAGASAAGVTGAESSTAQDENKPKDIESAVRNALSGSAAEQSSSSGDRSVGGEVAASVKVDPAKAGQPGAEDSELTEAEINLLKPRTRRSFERMRGQIGELEQKLQEASPAVEKLTGMQNFCREAGLTNEDVNAGFEIMKFMKIDPVRAFELLTPVYQSLTALVGEILPEDLQQQVVDGKISPQAAQEMSRLRAKTALTERRQVQQTEQQRQDAHRAQVKVEADAAGNAVSELEKQWQATDPDYRIKSTRVRERIELEMMKAAHAGKLPRSAQEAVAIASRAKKEVDDEFKRYLPKKASVQSVTGVGTSTGSKPAPKSTKEAILQAIGH